MPPKKRATKKKEEDTTAATPLECVIQEDIPHDQDHNSNDVTQQPVAPNEGEHIVLKLPIGNEELDKLIRDQDMSAVLQYVPTINDPQPYVPLNHFSNDADTLESVDVCPLNDNVPHTINTCNESSVSSRNKICFWCCHEVGHMTYGMPIRYDMINKSFTMFGTFCSLECAAAHNFSVHLGSDRAWEIHSWIQMLGKRFGYVEPIRPAPSRYLLDMFDGPLSIDDFRNAHKGQTRTYVLNIPPLISVNSQLEIVNTSFLGNTDEKRNHHPEKSSNATSSRKASEKRKTLDAKMNLTIQ